MSQKLEGTGRAHRAPRCALRRDVMSLWLGLGALANTTLLMAALFAALFLQISAAQAAGPRSWTIEDDGVRHVVIPVNKSKTFRLDQPFSTAVVGSPDIADALPMSDRSLYIQGKKIGTTNVSVFDTSMRLIGVLDIEVSVDTADVQSKIRSSTGSRGIRVSSTDGQVVLTGEAVDAVQAERAAAIAKSLSPNGVINAMSVAPTQQVLLKVSFLEANRAAERQLGVNFFGAKGNKIGFVTGAQTNVTTQNIPPNLFNGNGGGIASVPFVTGGGSPFGVVLANLVNGGTNIDVLVSMLETKGLVRQLAEPNLMALSGDTATFLAGGEFPVPIAAIGQSGAVTPTIEYKPFGVQLAFTPTVLQKGIINLKIAPSVSQLDFANAVQISGTTVPSLIKRDATTTIELRDGQSFAIAGLLQAMDARTRDQLPWIGSVPVLGALFSSNDFVKHDTDLVIIVTPHLVQPAAPGDRLASPLDSRLPSNDVDFFLLSQTDVKKAYNDYVTTGGGIEGPYGHMLRVEPAAPLAPVLPAAPAPVLPTLPISK